MPLDKAVNFKILFYILLEPVFNSNIKFPKIAQWTVILWKTKPKTFGRMIPQEKWLCLKNYIIVGLIQTFGVSSLWIV
jgi:hypothetical protein